MSATDKSAVRIIAAWAIFIGLALGQSTAFGQEDIQPLATVEHDANASQTSTCAEADGPAQVSSAPIAQSEKRRKALAGLAAVGGIAILGVGAIAATMVWARRLRRLARYSGPTQKTIGNDFWFLKPPKPIVPDTEISNHHRPPLGEKRDEP